MARMHAKEKTTSGDSSRVVSMQLSSEALCIASMHVVLLDRELHYYEKIHACVGADPDRSTSCWPADRPYKRPTGGPKQHAFPPSQNK